MWTSSPGPCLKKDLLNWMLATSCEQGHLDLVRLLVHGYDADVRDCAIHSNEFAVITGLPLYAAARAGRKSQQPSQHHTQDRIYPYISSGNEEIAKFLLQQGAGFSSYTLTDHPAFCKNLLGQKMEETSSPEEEEVRG